MENQKMETVRMAVLDIFTLIFSVKNTIRASGKLQRRNFCHALLYLPRSASLYCITTEEQL